MFKLASAYFTQARAQGAAVCRRFGLHCATHQIRIILVSCVVITSLFYPALALYSTAGTNTSSFWYHYTRFPSFDINRNGDPRYLWEGHDQLKVVKEFEHKKCGLRMERVFIDIQDESETAEALWLSTAQLEQRLSAQSSTACLSDGTKKCFVLSPLSFFGQTNEREVPNVTTAADVEVSSDMVLQPSLLSLTYFFPDCRGEPTGHEAWLKYLDSVASTWTGSELTIDTDHTRSADTIALTYFTLPPENMTSSSSAISLFVWVGYLAFFAYVSWSMRRMDSVHSRVGIVFTGLVEIAVSTITSLSVCALVGFKVTLVPWELLPIVIVYVGAETMFKLVEAVYKTPITLPVKDRIAEGLALAGTSNTLTVVSYNAILGIIAFFSAGAIRQFCAFAVVVLVAHWFLAHTLFLAVLSIDIQRLELDDLIRQNPNLGSPMSAKPKATTNKQKQKPVSKTRNLMRSVRAVLKSRATKDISLFLLLAITTTLYYTTSTYPASSLNSPRKPMPTPHNAKTNTDIASDNAWRVWQVLNPTLRETTIQIHVEAPTLVSFGPSSSHPRKAAQKTRKRTHTMRLAWWALSIVVLPITLTTTVLYGLLLYLLKDADLLEAQRNRGSEESSSPATESLESKVEFTTLPRAFASDVELISTSGDGRVVASVGLLNELVIWHESSVIHVDTVDLLLRSASTSSTAVSALTSIAVDESGSFCAVGTGFGLVAVWSLDRSNSTVSALPHLCIEQGMSAAIVQLEFVNKQPSPPQSTSSPVENQPVAWLVAVYENGVMAKWAVGPIPSVTYITPSSSAGLVKSCLFRLHMEQRLLAGFYLDDGSVEVRETQDFDLITNTEGGGGVCTLFAGTRMDYVAKIHATRAQLDGAKRLVIATATESGVVSLWDGLTSELITTLDSSGRTINSLRVSSIPSETCPRCGELPLDSLCIAYSVDSSVKVYKAFLCTQGSKRCSCPQNHPRPLIGNGHTTFESSSGGRLSRSASMHSLNGSPHIRPTIPASFKNGEFPVSGHGVHSRKASENNGSRRTGSEILTISTEDTRSEITASSPPWNSFVVEEHTEATCERGRWELANTKLVGICRKPRGNYIPSTSPNSNSHSPSNELGRATMERWEVWMFDPAKSVYHTSSLVVLASTVPNAKSKSQVPRLPFTRVAPLAVCPTGAVAGFGNTVGVFAFVGV